ncbi:MAG TPA: hydroxyphenylacetyl-CoA thioesterase PaaI [Actinomycetales bacterium]|nr:hydroxyphenylacetyl-CoA thioesterase PaaI [Actinomycetales bacterium]
MTSEGDVVARRSAEVMWAADTASRAMGMELLEIGPGRATLRMPVRDDMVMGHGTVHGGVVFTLADSAFAFACNSGGTVTVASSADITFVAPASLGEVLVAEALQETTFGRNGVTRVRVTREDDGGLVALFQGRSRSLGRPITEGELP